MNAPTVVVGGNLRQAAEWAKGAGLHQREVKLVVSDDAAQGLEPGRVVLVGSFWHRGDAVRIYETLRRCVARMGYPRPPFDDLTRTDG